MNNDRLSGKRIAILATEGFEQPELEKPREALDQAGAKTEIGACRGSEDEARGNVDLRQRSFLPPSTAHRRSAMLSRPYEPT